MYLSIVLLGQEDLWDDMTLWEFVMTDWSIASPNDKWRSKISECTHEVLDFCCFWVCKQWIYFILQCSCSVCAVCYWFCQRFHYCKEFHFSNCCTIVTISGRSEDFSFQHLQHKVSHSQQVKFLHLHQFGTIWKFGRNGRSCSFSLHFVCNIQGG